MKVVTISPLTRIEGLGRVDLHLRDGHLQRVELALLETPRFFESLMRSRSCLEIPALVCRICSICSAVHRLAAAAAIESALRLQIPPAAELVRELLLLGGHIESHALHLFCLIYPDLRDVESIIPLLAAGDENVKAGLGLKKLGQRIQEVTGGRAIHPVNIEVGGILVLPRRTDLLVLLGEVEEMQSSLSSLLLPFESGGSYPPARPALGTRLTIAAEREFTLQGGELALSDGRRCGSEGYADLLKERSFLSANARSPGEELFLVGALARQENFRCGQGRISPPGDFGIHGNNIAQAEELSWALERSRILIREIMALKGEEIRSLPVRMGAGVGTTVIEAPRGLLIHHYEIDAGGRIASADIVTPTAINQRTIEGQLFADLQDLPEEVLADRTARIVRAFDPCISCAVHLLRG